MRIAIADPPYLGRARRWYGAGGRGSGGGLHRADEHPAAADWDKAESHTQLVSRLLEDFDAWAIAAAPSSLAVYLSAVPADTRIMVWHRRNAVPSGARIRACWEPVLVHTPRRSYGSGLAVNDVLDTPAPTAGFAGSKPAKWTRWVLDAIGYEPEIDTVEDLFRGTGRVGDEVRQGVLL